MLQRLEALQPVKNVIVLRFDKEVEAFLGSLRGKEA